MARKQHDVLSIEWIKLELIRTAYATRGGLFSKMDPRAVLAWYLILAIAPWFTHNLTVPSVFFILGVISVALAKVGPPDSRALCLRTADRNDLYIYRSLIFWRRLNHDCGTDRADSKTGYNLDGLHGSICIIGSGKTFRRSASAASADTLGVCSQLRLSDATNSGRRI